MGLLLRARMKLPESLTPRPPYAPAPRPLARPVPAERGEIPEHTIDEKQTLFMGKV